MEWLWLKMLGSLLLIVALIVATMWLLKKFMAFSKPAQGAGVAMEVAGVLHLGPRRAVYAVKAGSQVILLGVAEHAITYLTQLSGSPDAGAEGAPFAAVEPVGAATPFFGLLKEQFMRSAGSGIAQQADPVLASETAPKKQKSSAVSRKKAPKLS
jgi:flagellar biosynthetic protein FliO